MAFSRTIWINQLQSGAMMLDLAKYVIHAPQFAITWLMFFGFGLVIYSTYAIRNNFRFAFKELLEHCIPINLFTERSFHADVKIYVIAKLIGSFVLIPALLLNGWFCSHESNLLKSIFPTYKPLEFTVAIASACTIVMFLVSEFSDFLSHYIQHKVPVLWELHKVHHSAQSLNPLTSKRGHPLALVLEGLMSGALTAVPGGLFIFLFGLTVTEAMSLSVVASKIFVIATLDPLKHSHYPISLGIFDRLLISPHMHQIHHSKTQAHWDKNFGTNLSVFDWIIGTGYKPARGEKAVYGISGYSDETLGKYNTMYGAYIHPMVRIYKRIKKMLSVANIPRLSARVNSQ